jgi:hypothetical protein
MVTEGLFEKFKRIISGSAAVKEDFIHAVFEKTGITISKDDFTIQSSVVWITGSPGLKNELFMHKNGILSVLAQRKSTIRDIR